MSFIDDITSLESVSDTTYVSEIQSIKNEYFRGKPRKNITYLELTPKTKEFILYLVSYSLNFETKKTDYYYRLAKKVQELFQLPGWLLIIPYGDAFTKGHLKLKIKERALDFKKELANNDVIISAIQAHILNKMFRNFLWE